MIRANLTQNIREYDVELSGVKKRFALVVSRFNEQVTESLLHGALFKLRALGVAEEDITIIRVPGAFEIPGVCKRLIQGEAFDAIITLGAVIRGETSHYDAVVSSVTSGIASLSLEGKIPVLFGVLTTDTVEQAMNRAGLKSGNKGSEVAENAVELANLYAKLK